MVLREQEAKNRDPADDPCGDYWDYVAYDPEHRLVLAVIPGARPEENGGAIVAEVEGRLGGELPELMTSDEYPVYEAAIWGTFGEPAPSERKPGRPRGVPERGCRAAWSTRQCVGAGRTGGSSRWSRGWSSGRRTTPRRR